MTRNKSKRTYYTLIWQEFHPDHVNGNPTTPYMTKKSMTFTTRKALEWAWEDLPKNPNFFQFKRLETFKA